MLFNRMSRGTLAGSYIYKKVISGSTPDDPSPYRAWQERDPNICAGGVDVPRVTHTHLLELQIAVCCWLFASLKGASVALRGGVDGLRGSRDPPHHGHLAKSSSDIALKGI